MEGAENRLSLPVGVSAFVLPLAVSTFKVNRTGWRPSRWRGIMASLRVS
jgi:hypothetical protein